MSEDALKLIAENKRTGATDLDLSACELSEIPPEIAELAWLERLILGGLGHYWRFTDLWPLSGLVNLQILDLSYTRATDLTPLSGLSNLKLLYLAATPVADLTPLSGLAGLLKLSLWGTQVTAV